MEPPKLKGRHFGNNEVNKDNRLAVRYLFKKHLTD